VGLKLAASRRANDPLLDPVIAAAERYHFPVLHHVLAAPAATTGRGRRPRTQSSCARSRPVIRT